MLGALCHWCCCWGGVGVGSSSGINDGKIGFKMILVMFTNLRYLPSISIIPWRLGNILGNMRIDVSVRKEAEHKHCYYLAFIGRLLSSFLWGRDGDWLDLFTWPSRDILARLTQSTTHHRREQNVYVPLLQWQYFRNFKLFVSHTNIHAGCTLDTGDHGKLFGPVLARIDA